MKNHPADPGIRFLTKPISMPYGRATAMPTALELKSNFFSTISKKYDSTGESLKFDFLNAL